jgi:hypothetical protein
MVLSASNIAAQDSSRAAPRDTTAGRPNATARQLSQPLQFSGVIFANYQYGGPKGNRSLNRFELERAYLNFRVNPADRFTVRVTADVFQQRDTTRDAYYRGWAMRAKYAYGQYEFYRGNRGMRANVRLGLLNTVVIDNDELAWPRGIATTVTDQLGFFSSADAGATMIVSLPDSTGEVYAGITNGSGYQSRELDRFKDYSVRVTYTPLLRTQTAFRTVAISPWYSLGGRASDFARRRGTVAPVVDRRDKSRAGLLVTLRDPRLTIGAHAAWRFEQDESADTTRDVIPTVRDRTGRALSMYVIARPLAFTAGRTASPFSVLLRVDDYRPNTTAPAGSRFTVAGVAYDINSRLSLTLDHQTQYPRAGATGADTKTWFAHVIANF